MPDVMMRAFDEQGNVYPPPPPWPNERLSLSDRAARIWRVVAEKLTISWRPRDSNFEFVTAKRALVDKLASGIAQELAVEREQAFEDGFKAGVEAARREHVIASQRPRVRPLMERLHEAHLARRIAGRRP